MSLMVWISSHTYERFSPLGLATQFGTTLRGGEGATGRQRWALADARLGFSARGDGRGEDAHHAGLSSPAKPALMLDPPQSSTTMSLRTVILCRRVLAEGARGAECDWRERVGSTSARRVGGRERRFAQSGPPPRVARIPFGTGGKTALPAPPTEPEAIEVTSRSKWASISRCSRACAFKTPG